MVVGTTPFTVDVLVRQANTGYQGYQYFLQWNPAILAYDSQTDLMPASLTSCAGATVYADSVYATCSRSSGLTTFTGPVNTVTLHCLADGGSALHLITLVENAAFGTGTVDDSAAFINTGLTDASVTCTGVTAPPAQSPIVSVLRTLGMLQRALPWAYGR
jgi:hypothetical protein